MTEPGTAAGPKPAELLGAKHDDPDPTGPLTDYESVPDTAATDDAPITQTMTHVEWGIEFGDGDIDIMPNRSACVEAIQIMDDEIKAGVYDEADYAGRRVVKRVVTVATTMTPWRAPGAY